LRRHQEVNHEDGPDEKQERAGESERDPRGRQPTSQEASASSTDVAMGYGAEDHCGHAKQQAHPAQGAEHAKKSQREREDRLDVGRRRPRLGRRGVRLPRRGQLVRSDGRRRRGERVHRLHGSPFRIAQSAAVARDHVDVPARLGDEITSDVVVPVRELLGRPARDDLAFDQQDRLVGDLKAARDVVRDDAARHPEPLAGLFDGGSQLIVYHFMFGPGWKEGCKSCSYLADHFDGANWHLPHRDVTLVVISRAPLAEFEPYRKRMGWRFPWVSSSGNDFNFDYHVSFTKEEEAEGKVYYNYETTEFISDELPGLTVFYRDEAGGIYHTYSTYARGLDPLVGAYNFLDLVPKGRDENSDSTMSWVRRHDEYEN